ncbi:hypothetical protein C8Q74DRAFT_541143 [Fomes fomentarius]|nr:hypothetical protein C8Q74DRAFT_541143 [Fomes fomentarius]
MQEEEGGKKRAGRGRGEGGRAWKKGYVARKPRELQRVNGMGVYNCGLRETNAGRAATRRRPSPRPPGPKRAAASDDYGPRAPAAAAVRAPCDDLCILTFALFSRTILLKREAHRAPICATPARRGRDALQKAVWAGGRLAFLSLAGGLPRIVCMSGSVPVPDAQYLDIHSYPPRPRATNADLTTPSPCVPACPTSRPSRPCQTHTNSPVRKSSIHVTDRPQRALRASRFAYPRYMHVYNACHIGTASVVPHRACSTQDVSSYLRS